MAKDKFAANANRVDPYKSFKFRLKTAAVGAGNIIRRVTRLPIDRLRQALSRASDSKPPD